MNLQTQFIPCLLTRINRRANPKSRRKGGVPLQKQVMGPLSEFMNSAHETILSQRTCAACVETPTVNPLFVP